MIQIAVLVAAMACQSQPPAAPAPPPPVVPNAQAAKGDLGFVVRPETPAIAPRTGGDFLRSRATPPASGATPASAAPQPSVADLFRQRNAREAAARASEPTPTTPADGEYHCRRTANSVTCGTNEETMRRTEEAAKARLDELLSPD